MNPFIMGDLVTMKADPPSWSKRKIHKVTKVDGDFFWIDNQHYRIDRHRFEEAFLVTLASPEHIKR